jgi:hypothetical protein
MTNPPIVPSDAFSNLANPDLQNARFAVAHITGEGLAEASVTLYERARAERSKTVLGLSILFGMASETGLGALTLYNQKKWYAGAALTRQLVEHHHLCDYFAKDLERVVLWLDADEKKLQRIFSPRALRSAGGFTNVDYAAHCKWGGHPNPHGMWLMSIGEPDPRRELLLVDIVQHLQFIYVAAVKCVGEEVASEVPGMVKAFNYITKWRHVDPYASGLPVGDKAQQDASPDELLS